MKGKSTLLGFLAIIALSFAMSQTTMAQVPDTSLIVSISLNETGCVNQTFHIYYTGNAPEWATFTWNFDGAVVLGGSGQGPYEVKWETTGVKEVTLIVHWDTLSGETSRLIHVMPYPEVFHVTGGGAYTQGGPGVEIGLSGSQIQTYYILGRYASNDSVAIVMGTGFAISFGHQTEPGTYTVLAANYGYCETEMEGSAVITVISVPEPNLCMVTFDTVSHKNVIIWNKPETDMITQVNIYKETYQNEEYEKIAEVPFSQPGIYTDNNSFPLVRSYKYRVTFVDTSQHESERTPYHKTVHLNINAGIYGFNLIWNHYEGFEFQTYNIYRRINDSPFEKIAMVASNVDSYTDFYTGSGVAVYYIEVIRPEPCQPGIKAGDYSSIVSNFAAAAPLGIEDKSVDGVFIYPNPVTDKVFITLEQGQSNSCRVDILNPNGQLLLSREMNGNRSEIDLSGFAPGVYFLRISSENSVVVKKIVKE